jgi:hypothetical protein
MVNQKYFLADLIIRKGALIHEGLRPLYVEYPYRVIVKDAALLKN